MSKQDLHNASEEGRDPAIAAGRKSDAKAADITRDVRIESTPELLAERTRADVRGRIFEVSDTGIDLTSLSPEDVRSPNLDQFEAEEPEVLYWHPGIEPPPIQYEYYEAERVPEEDPSLTTRRSFLRDLGLIASGSTLAGVSIGLLLGRWLEKDATSEPSAEVPKGPVAVKELSPEEEQALEVISRVFEKMDNGEAFADLLTAESKEVQTAIQAEAKNKLGEVKGTPDGSQVLNWFRYREILKTLDEKASDAYKVTATRALGAGIQYYNNWEKEDNPIAQLDLCAKAFKEIYDYVEPRDQQRLLSRIRLYDRQMQSRADLVPGYIQSIIRRANDGFMFGDSEKLEDIKVPGLDKNMKEYLLEQADVTENEDGSLTYDWKAEGQKIRIDAGNLGSDEKPYIFVRFVSDKDPLQQVTLSPANVKFFIDSDGMHKFGELARDWRAMEMSHVAELQAFDLPKDSKTAYIRVFPEERDTVIDGALSNGMVMAATLKNVYKDKIDIKPLVFSSDAARDLTRAVSNAHGEGRKTFFIDLYGHGSFNGISLGSNLSSRDIVTLVDAFPDSQFIFSTIACHGGGMIDALHTQNAFSPDRQKRMMFMTQVKEEMVNVLAYGRDAENAGMNHFGSMYYAYFQEKLLAGGTFGEAVRHADIETKTAVGIDANTLFKGHWIAGAESSDLQDPLAPRNV